MDIIFCHAGADFVCFIQTDAKWEGSALPVQSVEKILAPIIFAYIGNRARNTYALPTPYKARREHDFSDKLKREGSALPPILYLTESTNRMNAA